MSVVADVAAAVCFLAGSLLALVAGVGLVRFPDLLARMHAATKPQVLGLVLMVLGLAIQMRSAPVLGTLLLVILFQLITAPVAAHMVGRAGYRTGKVRSDLLVRDELTADRQDAEHRRRDGAGVAGPAASGAAPPDAGPPSAARADAGPPSAARADAARPDAAGDGPGRREGERPR